MKTEQTTGATRAFARELEKAKANKAFYAKVGDYAVESRQVQRQRLRRVDKEFTNHTAAVNAYRDAARAARGPSGMKPATERDLAMSVDGRRGRILRVVPTGDDRAPLKGTKNRRVIETRTIGFFETAIHATKGVRRVRIG